MLLLTSTSDIVRVVTGSAVSSILVHASYVDNASGTITPGRTNTSISTATTTTVVAAPGASTQRNVKGLYINNTSAASCVVTVQHYDGTTSITLMSVTLRGGESLTLDDTGSWTHRDTNGAAYLPNVASGLFNYSTVGVITAYATNTLVAGSSILLPTGINVGGVQYEVIFDVAKTAAGTAGIVIQVRYGTTQTTADALVTTATFGAGTAVADTGIFTLRTTVSTAGASASAVSHYMINHLLAATGLTNSGAAGTAIFTPSSTFDSTTTNAYLTVWFNGGTAFSGTTNNVQARVFNYRG